MSAQSEAESWLEANLAGQPTDQACADGLSLDQDEIFQASKRSKRESTKTSVTESAHLINASGTLHASAQTESNKDVHANGWSGTYSEKEWLAWEEKQLEASWWKNCLFDSFDFKSDEEQSIMEKLRQSCEVRCSEEDAMASSAGDEPQSVTSRMVCAAVRQVEPRLEPVHTGTMLIGLDSLRIARLTAIIKAQSGCMITVSEVRNSRTVAELAKVVASAEAAPPSDASHDAYSDFDSEYAVWFSPAQCTPMGHWVLRKHGEIDLVAARNATRQLTDRHSALRAELIEPMRYLSLLDYSASIWTLYGSLMNLSSFPLAHKLRRCISWSLTKTWPRVRCRAREQLYSKQYHDSVPFEVVRIDDGQADLEHQLQESRHSLKLPYVVMVYNMHCHIADVWAYKLGHDHGQFTILRRGAADLVYIDVHSGEWGPLVSNHSPSWQAPPHGFPSLFFVPLSNGSVAWLRLERADELRVLYRHGKERSDKHYHMVAFRAAPQRERPCPATVVSFLTICMMHHLGDGNCFMPLSQDLLALYEDECSCKASPAPLPVFNGLEVLQQRLFDTILYRQGPNRASLRGVQFRYRGRGYGHGLAVEPGMTAALMCAAAKYHVPFDITLLALLMCAIARADRTEVVEWTLYVPMRDGMTEASMVGLFADWRDLSMNVDFELATVLGSVLQLSHTIQHRRWSVFNALRKPERTVVNMQVLQVEQRNGFKQIGEHGFWGGDTFKKRQSRGDSMEFTKQAISASIEQISDLTWWIGISVGADVRPPPWMRCFITSFKELLNAFLAEPLAKVHLPILDTAS
eukprot:TRINITY_DN46852_c0_g1_i1.p1 TRINITY_DN46852_c0_g1~~TRINITY_DN46852_c0_g1_i1.p1  ORF type:complete len:916 (+),score=127.99 TRINITY_DN46852_c0_g1_i1:342-2750(+)